MTVEDRSRAPVAGSLIIWDRLSAGLTVESSAGIGTSERRAHSVASTGSYWGGVLLLLLLLLLLGGGTLVLNRPRDALSLTNRLQGAQRWRSSRSRSCSSFSS
eukprot:COSAG02_NODE_207_length_29119_cov_41.071365_3_plen_103_part_00